MALNDESGMGTTMLVQPSGGMPYWAGNNSNGFMGGDGW